MNQRAKRSGRPSETTLRPLVAVVDDDVSVRESLPEWVKSLGFDAMAYASARDFLACGDLRATRCLLLDVAMPDMSGPELLRELRSGGHRIPVVFITGQANEAVRGQLLEQGAVDCLFKPFSEQQLRAALELAVGPRGAQ